MRCRLFHLATLAVFLTVHSETVSAQAPGLHNDTKQFTKQYDMTPEDIGDPDQIRRTWMSAVVRMPEGSGRSRKTSIAELSAKFGDGANRFPTVIYLHGCTGIWPGTHRRIKFFADSGFLVIAPASLARTKYPMSCDPKTRRGGMYRPTLQMRKLDAGHAIEMAKTLPFVDADNMVLAGFSQGGVTAATFKPANDKQFVRARVIEGWTCAAGWSEYAGINAPANEPVLSLVSAGDPWFQNPWNKGDCGKFMNDKNGSKSIVFNQGVLAKEHALLEFKQAQNAVLAFLKLYVDIR